MIQPRDVPPPGEILVEEFLKPGGLTQAAAAAKLGWTPARLNQVAKGRRAVTADAALDLAALLGTTPQFWMNLQTMHDVDRAIARRSRSRTSYSRRAPVLVAAEPRKG
jgi:addiction module HigA family antidote